MFCLACKHNTQTCGLRGKQDTITDQMWATDEVTGGLCVPKKRGLLLFWRCIRGCGVRARLASKAPVPNVLICLKKLYVNDQTSIFWWIALHYSPRDSSLGSHDAFQWNMKLLSHWGKSKSCSAAVLWAALCCIALETGLIGMCGPNSPHRLKLAGFMFTTIGFRIAALDCLCFAVWVCVHVRVCVTSRVQS